MVGIWERLWFVYKRELFLEGVQILMETLTHACYIKSTNPDVITRKEARRDMELDVVEVIFCTLHTSNDNKWHTLGELYCNNWEISTTLALLPQCSTSWSAFKALKYYFPSLKWTGHFPSHLPSLAVGCKFHEWAGNNDGWMGCYPFRWTRAKRKYRYRDLDRETFFTVTDRCEYLLTRLCSWRAQAGEVCGGGQTPRPHLASVQSSRGERNQRHYSKTRRLNSLTIFFRRDVKAYSCRTKLIWFCR